MTSKTGVYKINANLLKTFQVKLEPLFFLLRMLNRKWKKMSPSLEKEI